MDKTHPLDRADNDAAAPPRPRTRFQFNLATLLWLMLVLGIALAWWKDRRDFDRRLAAIESRFYPVSSSWSPDEACGAPNTNSYGDLSTAWASSTPDGQQEWLLLTFKSAVVPSAVVIHETYNPGAVYKVAVVDSWGVEKVVWQGADPVANLPTGQIGVATIPLNVKSKVNKVKVFIDSPKVPGWNEIDAVGLKDQKGNVQWATAAEASSSFGSRYTTSPYYPPIGGLGGRY